MKGISISLATLLVASTNLSASEYQSKDITVVYLVDENDKEEQNFFANEGNSVVVADEESADPRQPLTQKQSRIHSKITKEQEAFLSLMSDFLSSEFDVDDDQAVPEFSKIRSEIVRLVFKSPTERDFYARLYLINQSWLENQSEFARYSSLDRALRDEWVKREEKRKQIREIMIGATSLVGAAAGTYLMFRASAKVLPIGNDEKTLGLILRWLGRAPLILVGAGVGAAAGAYVGFLGSDYLLYRQYEFLRPVDGDEDLRELLDLIDQLH